MSKTCHFSGSGNLSACFAFHVVPEGYEFSIKKNVPFGKEKIKISFLAGC
jgi:hypothetical protein